MTTARGALRLCAAPSAAILCALRSNATWASALVVLAACTPFGGSEGDATDRDGGATSTAGPDGGPGPGGTPSEAELLVTGLTNPQQVHATSGGVYWLSVGAVATGTANQIHRCDLDGCKGRPTRLRDEPIDALSADDSGVFWGSNEQLWRCDLGATCAPSQIASVSDRIWLLVAAQGQLVFAAGEGVSTRLFRCAPGECAAATPLSDGPIGVLAVSGQDLYFTSGAGSNELVRIRNGPPTALGALRGLPNALAAAGTQIYSVSDRQLWHCDAATACAPQLFAKAESAVFDVRVEGDAVFYTVTARGGAAGRIERCPLGDCTSPTRVHEGGNPRWLSLRDGWAYFSDDGGGGTGNGSIYRVRLPAP